MNGDADSKTSLTLLERLCTHPDDPSVWEPFVLRYRPKILAWCGAWGVPPADAEDVAQEVLAKLVVAMRDFRYDPSRSFRAWLKTITQRTWSDLASRRRPTPGEGLSALADISARDDLALRLAEAFDLEVLDEAMRRVRGRVAEATWEAFRLTALDGLSGAEASPRTGLSVAQVFVAKHRVQKLLRAEVQTMRARPADGSLDEWPEPIEG